ncbi:MAG: hypothetical protein ACPGSE_07145, partial [Synechococcus sp.]
NAIKELGLDARTLAAQSPDRAFRTITEAMQGVESQSDKVRLAFKLFDSEGVGLVNTMAGGVEALDEYAREVELLGVALDRVDAAKIEAANDSIYRVQTAAKGAGQAFAVALAPYIEATAKWLLESAKQAGGFRRIAVNAVEGTVTAVGKLGDAIRVVQVGWLALKGAFQVVGAAVNGLINRIANGPVYAINGALDAINTLIRQANRLPGINLPELDISLKPIGQLEGAWKASLTAIEETWDELKATATDEWPSDKVKAFFAEIKAEAEQAAQKVADVRPGGAQFTQPTASNAGGTAKDSAEDKERARLEAGIERLTESLMTEEERLRESYERREFMVETAFQDGIVNEQHRKELLEQLEADHQAKLVAIQQAGLSEQHRQWLSGWQGKAKVMSGILGDLSALQNSENKKQARLGKRAAIAQAAIDTVAGAQKAFTALAGIPIVGPALGAAAAAAAIVAGKARINAIKSGTVGGGGGGNFSAGAGGSGAGSSLAIPSATPAAQQQQAPQITIHVA